MPWSTQLVGRCVFCPAHIGPETGPAVQPLPTLVGRTGPTWAGGFGDRPTMLQA
jgi:hypothetical protein